MRLHPLETIDRVKIMYVVDAPCGYRSAMWDDMKEIGRKWRASEGFVWLFTSDSGIQTYKKGHIDKSNHVWSFEIHIQSYPYFVLNLNLNLLALYDMGVDCSPKVCTHDESCTCEDSWKLRYIYQNNQIPIGLPQKYLHRIGLNSVQEIIQFQYNRLKEFISEGKEKVIDWIELYTTNKIKHSNIRWHFQAFEYAFDFSSLNVTDLENEMKHWTGFKTVKYHSLDGYSQFVLPTAMLTNRTNQLHTYQKSCEQMRLEYQVNDKDDCLVLTNFLRDNVKPKVLLLGTSGRSHLTIEMQQKLELREIKSMIFEALKKMDVNPFEMLLEKLCPEEFREKFIQSLSKTMELPMTVLRSLIHATSYNLAQFDSIIKRKLRENDLLSKFDRKRQLYYPSSKMKSIQFVFENT